MSGYEILLYTVAGLSICGGITTVCYWFMKYKNLLGIKESGYNSLSTKPPEYDFN